MITPDTSSSGITAGAVVVVVDNTPKVVNFPALLVVVKMLPTMVDRILPIVVVGNVLVVVEGVVLVDLIVDSNAVVEAFVVCDVTSDVAMISCVDDGGTLLVVLSLEMAVFDVVGSKKKDWIINFKKLSYINSMNFFYFVIKNYVSKLEKRSWKLWWI